MRSAQPGSHALALHSSTGPHAFPHATQDTLLNSAGDVFSTLIAWTVCRAVRDARAARHPT